MLYFRVSFTARWIVLNGPCVPLTVGVVPSKFVSLPVVPLTYQCAGACSIGRLPLRAVEEQQQPAGWDDVALRDRREVGVGDRPERTAVDRKHRAAGHRGVA